MKKRRERPLDRLKARAPLHPRVQLLRPAAAATMPKRKVRGARAPGAGPPPPPPLPPPSVLLRRSPRLRGARAGYDAGAGSAARRSVSRRCQAAPGYPARFVCPRAPEAILEERRPRREEPCWRLFIPLPSGSTCPPPMAKLSLPPPVPSPRAGNSNPKGREGGVLGWRAGGTRCRQKTAAVRGRDPPSWGRGFDAAPPPPAHRPRPQRTRLGAGARRCRPRVPPLSCVRLPSPALDGCHGNGAWAPPPEGFVCSLCSCCFCLARRRGPHFARLAPGFPAFSQADWGSYARCLSAVRACSGVQLDTKGHS